jgi:hypothetical protein
VIDGRGQLPGAERAAKVERFAETGQGAILTLDLTAAYDVPGLLALGRRFTWQRHGSLVLVDRIETDRAMPFEELFISRIRPTVEADRVVWEGDRARCVLTWQGPAARTPDVRTVETVETTGHRGELESVFRLRLRYSVEAGGSRLESVFTVERRER